VLKACGPLFDHKDKAVRDGAKEIAVRARSHAQRERTHAQSSSRPALNAPDAARQVEMTRWMGAAAVKRDLTDKMRDAQKKEVRCCARTQRFPLRTPSFLL
jgi:hypothetical protein